MNHLVRGDRVMNRLRQMVPDVVTGANESDMSHFVDVIDKASLPRGAIALTDKGYVSKANREALKARGLRDGIMHKASKGMRLTEEQREKNLSISRFRYRVERTFGSMRLWFKSGIARYVGLAKTTAQHLMEALAYNL